MAKLTQKQIQQALLACGMLLMMGWFTVWGSYLKEGEQVSRTDLAAIDEVPVLMYHHLVPAQEVYGLFANNNIVVTVEEFRQQMTELKARGYQTITLTQLQRFVSGEEALPAKSVVITFDDGYLSNYIYAYPILQELDYTAVIFLLTGEVSDTTQQYQPRALQYLSWPEVEQMKDCIEFGCHTDQLHRLNGSGQSVLMTTAPEEIAADLQLARQKLGPTNYYCYPYGHYNQQLIKTLQQEGITLAFTIGAASVRRGDDLLRLNRWDMYQYDLDEILSP